MAARPLVGEPISVESARRIALAAQGFGDPRPVGRADKRHVREVIERIGVLQLDSVNVLCRSHYLPVFARLGPYSRSSIDQMVWGGQDRRLFEYWAHKASILPVSTFPLMRWRMQAAERFDWVGWSTNTTPPPGWTKTLDPAIRLAPWAVISGMTRLAKERPSLIADVLAVVAERGPVAARDASPDGRRHGDGQDVGTGEMWNWHDTKIALEWLFYTGKVTTAARRNFERIYDVTERVLPAEVLNVPAPSRDDAQRELVRIAARAHGVSTERQLRDYFHLPGDHSKARVAELVETGELVPIRIDGLSKQAYLWSAATVPSQVQARALLSPFDSLIWDRDRTLRMFDFHYRISLYTPAAERTHGFYVLPFLLGDRLVARIDLKADRRESALLVPAANSEPGMGKSEVAGELAAELRLMASWLELDRVLVTDNGDLATPLIRALGRR